MIDKQELQDLLVRLQLGTLTVESTIKEIEGQFAENQTEPYSGIWARVKFGFDEVVFAADQDVSVVIARMDEISSKRRNFIVIGLSEEKTTVLAKRFPEFIFYHKAGVVAGKSKNRQVSGLAVNIIVSGVSRAEKRCADEVSAILSLAGMGVTVHPNMRDKTIADNSVMKKALKDASAVIVTVSDDAYTVPLAASLSTVPIVVLPVGGIDCVNVRTSDGLLFAHPEDSFGACMAVLRMLGSR